MLAIILLGSYLAFRAELKDWNGGICPAYDEPWEHRDNDSQGGRMYCCRAQTIWVSYVNPPTESAAKTNRIP